LHSDPEQPVVEALVNGRSIHLGRIDNSRTVGNIHRARATLRSVVDDGWFAVERSVVFDFVQHFPDVDTWLQYREDRRATSIVAPDLIEHARMLFSSSPAAMELRTSEHIQATRLSRLDRPADSVCSSQ
jgi:hypothetical protein